MTGISGQTIGLTWTTFKDFADARNLPMIWYVSNNHYFIYLADGPLSFETRLRIDSPSAGDQLDFETNYKNDANDTPIGNKIIGNDGTIAADVVVKNFRNALVTDAFVTVEQVFGFDDFADSWFFIDDTGDTGTIWQVDLPAGTQDTTSPSDNDPAVSVQITVTGTEQGDEELLRDKIIAALNADLNFDSAWRAKAIKDNPAVHIQSKRIGEKGDRLTPGDFAITFAVTVGTPAFSLQQSDNDILKRRGKQNSGSRDPRDPRLVTIGISGEVQAVPGAAGDIFEQNLTDNGEPTPDQGGTGSADLRVNGTLGSPMEFSIGTDMTSDIFITELRFYGGGNGIQFGQFLSKNGKLTNGVLVEIRSDEQIKDFSPLKSTEDFKNKWAYGSGSNFRLDAVSGADQFLAVLIFQNPFPLRKTGTYITGDDYVKCFIRDNLNSGLQEFEIRAFGFYREV